MKVSWFILLTINIYLYKYFDIEYSAICFVTVLIKIIYDLGLFTQIVMTRTYFNECVIYYYEYTGDYCNVFLELDKIDQTLNQKKLNEDKNYFKFGIYYDDPKMVDKTRCRAVVGIMTYSLNNKENEEFILKNGYYKKHLERTESVKSIFPYINGVSIGIAVYKFYSKFFKMMEEFKKFKVKEDYSKYVIELYKDDRIEFHVILNNIEEFLLHKSFKKAI